MSWKAEQIYTLPDQNLKDAFLAIPELKNKIFNVKDLEGIRSEHTLSNIFSDTKTEFSHQKHNLPEEGLMVIYPSISTSRYYEEIDGIWLPEDYQQEDKWKFLPEEPLSSDIIELSEKGYFSDEQLLLFQHLRELNKTTNIPINYYYCEMWAGDIEEEYSVVFDNSTYYYDTADGVIMELMARKETDSTPLQLGLKHSELILPTWFFVLHEGSFDWKRYKI